MIGTVIVAIVWFAASISVPAVQDRLPQGARTGVGEPGYREDGGQAPDLGEEG
jgi:hypothetical protein